MNIQDIAKLLNKTLDEKLQPIKDDIKELKTDVAELKTDVAELKTDVAELKTDVAELKTDMIQVKSEIKNIKIELTEVHHLASENRQILGQMFTYLTDTNQELHTLKNTVTDNHSPRLTRIETNLNLPHKIN